MFMIQAPLDAARLMRFSRQAGHRLSPGDDFGYALHAWLAAVWGGSAPKPFRLLENRRGHRLLAYSSQSAAELRDLAAAAAEPSAHAVCDWEALEDKKMPSAWQAGQRFAFEVRACPVIRRGRERDAFLAALDQAKENQLQPPGRVEVYLDWLERRFSDRPGGRAAELIRDRLDLKGFRRVRTLRRSIKGKPDGRIVERPDALFTGELVIRDPAGFADLLARGVGRHRAFGFGMLLLRPGRT